jgi:hypothetical protein
LALAYRGRPGANLGGSRAVRHEEAGPASSPRTADERRDALAERLFEATIGTLGLSSVHLGFRLGLYDARWPATR